MKDRTDRARVEALTDEDIDRDVFEWFRCQGLRHQTKINAVLRTYVEAHSRR